MKFGDLVFFKPKGIIGKVISFFSGEFSHVAIVLDEFHLASALPNGIEIYHMDSSDYVVKHVELTQEQIKNLRKFIFNKIGCKYEYSELIRYLLERYIEVNLRFWNNPNKFICSEFCYEAFNSVGVDLLPEHAGVISPTHLSESTLYVKEGE